MINGWYKLITPVRGSEKHTACLHPNTKYLSYFSYVQPNWRQPNLWQYSGLHWKLEETWSIVVLSIFIQIISLSEVLQKERLSWILYSIKCRDMQGTSMEGPFPANFFSSATVTQLYESFPTDCFSPFFWLISLDIW